LLLKLKFILGQQSRPAKKGWGRGENRAAFGDGACSQVLINSRKFHSRRRTNKIKTVDMGRGLWRGDRSERGRGWRQLLQPFARKPTHPPYPFPICSTHSTLVWQHKLLKNCHFTVVRST